MIACPMCSKVFKSRGKLNSHTATHTKEKPHKCLTCPAAFAQFNTIMHTQAVHYGVKVIKNKNNQCPKCSYKCAGPAQLKMHLCKHSTELPFSCSIPGCNFKTKQETNLAQHVRRVHIHEERPLKCTVEGCNYQALFPSALNNHVKVHSNEKPFVCKFPGCSVKCKYKSTLKNHTSTVHSEDKPFECSTCDFRTKYKVRLQEHENEHKNIKSFHCQIPKCGFATQNKHSLQRHFEGKHAPKDIICKAPGCNYRCGSVAVLRNHAFSHVRPILKCPDNSCNYSTRYPAELRLHVSRKHTDLQPTMLLLPGQLTYGQPAGSAAAIEKLVCPFSHCDFQTEFQHRYDRHVKTHDAQRRKFACKFCSWRFSALSQLERHLRSHTGEKPISCAHCDYAAVDSGELRNHARRVHDIHVVPRGKGDLRRRKCRTCCRNCASYNEFVLHSMTHLMAVVVLERLNLLVG